MNLSIFNYPSDKDIFKSKAGPERTKLYDEAKKIYGKIDVIFQDIKTLSKTKEKYSSIEKVDSFSQSLEKVAEKLSIINDNFSSSTLSPFTVGNWSPEGYNFKESLDKVYQSRYASISCYIEAIERELSRLESFFDLNKKASVWYLNNLPTCQTYFEDIKDVGTHLFCAKDAFENDT